MMKTLSYARRTVCTFLLGGASIIALTTSESYARNGFIPHYVGLEGLIAGAGTALPLDSSSTIANPATLTRLETHLMGTVGILGQKQHVNTKNAYGPIPDPASNPINNSRGGQKNGYKAVPIGTFGINYRINPLWAVGFTVTGGGGFVKFKHPVTNPNFLAPPSNFNKKTVNQVILSATTLSYRPTTCQSYGISLLVASSSFKSDLAMPDGTQVTGRLKKNTVFGFGTRIGGIWDLNQYLTIGASAATPVYASRHNKYKQLFKHKFEIPATARLGAVIHMSPCTDLAFDLKKLFYGKSKWIHKGQGWETQTIYLVGITHKITPDIMLGIGYNYAKVPIKRDRVIFNALSIPLDEHHISGGVKYAMDKKMEVYVVSYFVPTKNMTDNGKRIPPAKGAELKNKGYGAELGMVYKF